VARARAEGWTVQLRPTAGGAQVYLLRRGIYKAVAWFWFDKYYRPTRRCDAARLTRTKPATCADEFELQIAR
jgi:hypothetical protein